MVFDWGNVIGFNDRSIVVDFMCDSFHFFEAEFEFANLKKRKAMKVGLSDTDFWLDFARKNEIQLPKDWAQDVERQIKTGHFKFKLHNKIHTFRDLITRYKQDGALMKKSQKNYKFTHFLPNSSDSIKITK